jgi:copper chaperone CopZ
MEVNMIRLEVPHMKSEKCRTTVMGALMGVDGDAECHVDLDAKQVALTSKFPPTDFVEALEEVGYTAFIAQS